MSQPDVTTLNQKFAIPGQLEFTEDVSGLIIVRIANKQAQATIALQGAHVMTFEPVGEKPVIWLSPAAKLIRGKSIRGGVPVCWPWFGAHATDSTFPAHGFARTVSWQVVASEALSDGSTRITFELPQNSIPVAQWPHACRVRNIVTIGKEMTVELITENTGQTTFEIGEALHTYFAISDVDKIRISGLEGCTYLDKVGDWQRKIQAGAITIAAEVDRLYVNTDSDCLINDSGYKRGIRIAKRGSLSTVVWNPWIEKAAKMGDFGSDTGYRGMVCVESANAAENVVKVAAGAIHSLHVVYSIEKTQ
ncbi:putative glucose-6-phosphate 1-epimerase [Candidatus Nitrotoga sp. HW29]|uniref:D-hexose-6-phosphate mutarotase n=1 Tax=Candidatus Nitrotoga sp. HW29 TaxID=2886963 RepID=UPI001EF33574|nr:D-hexose-6-phosphate mutarotase [Candidatus Nitrotoga sp. HW29]CAH1904893.1 putative glucose-6-phosphate 1-epimerase [Candidatus Nitrotoga sp. HW29]